MFDKLFVQKAYADNVGNRLSLYSVQSYSPYRSNFRCPICGDSARNKFKKRGYLLEKNGHLTFYCHNGCGTINFEKFLRDYYPDLYSQYRFDLFLDNNNNKLIENSNAVDISNNTFDENVNYLDGLDNIENDSDGYAYILNRKIPRKFHNDIWVTTNFHKYVNNFVVGKFKKSLENKNEKRIIFPLRYYDGTIFGINARSLERNNSSKYITIKFDVNKPKFFGLDRIDINKHKYVVEGPIDSFFIDNCVAMVGTDGNLQSLFGDNRNFTLILDNQPRNEQVINKYKKYISLGYQLVIWPNVFEGKDINDYVLSGGRYQKLKQIIEENTFVGLQAEIQFNRWRKI